MIGTAKALGVPLKTFSALHAEIRVRNITKSDVAIWGELEREFGVQSESRAKSKRDGFQAEEAPARLVSPGLKPENQAVSELKGKAELVVEDSEVPVENTQIDMQERNPVEENPTLAAAQPDNVGCPEIKNIEEKQNGEPAVEEAKAKDDMPGTPRAWADVVSNRTRPAQPKMPLPVPAAVVEPASADTGSEVSVNALEDPVAQDKTSNILDWVQKVKATANTDPQVPMSPPKTHKKHRSRKSKEVIPPTEEQQKPFRPILMQRPQNASQGASENVPSLAASDKAASQIVSNRDPSPLPTPPAENDTNGELIKHTPNVSVSSVDSVSANTPASQPRSVGTPPPKAETKSTDEPEDSDEEVVVFNPRAKRLSAQKADAVNKASPERRPVSRGLEIVQPPNATSGTQQVREPKAVSPAPPARDKPRKPNKTKAPVVIDPDAFGRDFASNPHGHHHNPRPHPHPRGGFYQGPPQRPASQHGPPPLRYAPQQGPPVQRPVSQHGPPRPHPRGGRVQPQNQAPLNVKPDVNGPNAYASSVQPGPSKDAAAKQSIQSINANGDVKKPRGGHEVRNGNIANTEHSHMASAPSGSPPNEAKAETTGPDVDFVLKTGSTRASTRGRGRLWIP